MHQLATSEGGFTLFEVLIYIGLFSIIMFGALVGAFQIIDSSVDTRQRVALEQEAHFIFRKIDFLLNGRVNVTDPSRGNISNILTVDGKSFEVNADGVFEFDGDLLTALWIKVTNFTVERTPVTEEDAVSVSFTLNDRQFATTTRYIR